MNFQDIQDKIFTAKSFISNPLQQGQIAYVVESRDWAIRQVGNHITKNTRYKAFVTASPWSIKHKILHFGSLHTIRDKNKIRSFEPSNKVILTVFHLVPNKKENNQLQDIAKKVDLIHTSAEISKHQLVQYGVPSEKIRVIPLGIDTNTFSPSSTEEKINLRKVLHINEDAFVIGSFQKDGEGWEKGLKPKLEKGPDIFVETIRAVSLQHPVHVLLVGPARGYIMQKLKESNIPFTYAGYLSKPEQVASYYKALDSYLITSRTEGGPLAFLESWASGIPVVSTRVGQVPDIATDKEDALLAASEDSSHLAKNILTLINDQQIRNSLRANALQQVKKYDWKEIAKRYDAELYKPLEK